MTSLFDRELTQMEREVRDLKTIHQRGLGATRFYRKSYTINGASSGFHTIEVHLADGELTPAIITAHIRTQTPVFSSYSRVDPQSYGANILVYNYTAGDVQIEIISTAQIQEIIPE